MSWNQIYSDEGRRSFTIATLGTFGLCSLIACLRSEDAASRVCFLFGALVPELLMFLLVLDNFDFFEVTSGNKVIGPLRLTLRGKHKRVKTLFGFVPDRNKSEEVTREERDISDKLKAIIGKMLSPSTARLGLDFLAAHESLVQRSWTHLLNRSRFLQVVNRTAEAEALAWAVIKRFSVSDVAVGTAYEVLSWIEESREPKGGGALYEQWLNKRMSYITQGLQHFPTGHDLLMNAFEVATLRHDSGEALAYLHKAASADRELTQNNLADNPRTKQAMRLSSELRRTIRGLIKGENKMQIFRTSKFTILAAVMAATLCVASGAAHRQAAQTPQGPAYARAALTAPLARVASAARQMCKSGTSLGKAGIGLAKAGTSLGQQ